MSPQTLAELFTAVGGVIFVDLVLSGDNALVIGAAAALMPRKQRWLALVFGGAGAIVVRIALTTFATFLLSNPILQIIGGVLVLFIATRLLTENEAEAPNQVPEDQQDTDTVQGLPPIAQRIINRLLRFTRNRINAKQLRFLLALTTILIADVTMSLDNIIAIGALAKGRESVLVIGLLLSILILLIGSALVSELIKRIPWLIAVASLLLTWISTDLVWNGLQKRLGKTSLPQYGFPLLLVLFGLIITIFIVRHFKRPRAKQPVSEPTTQKTTETPMEIKR